MNFDSPVVLNDVPGILLFQLLKYLHNQGISASKVAARSIILTYETLDGLEKVFSFIDVVFRTLNEGTFKLIIFFQKKFTGKMKCRGKTRKFSKTYATIFHLIFSHILRPPPPVVTPPILIEFGIKDRHLMI